MEARPRLSRELAESLAVAEGSAHGVEWPSSSMNALPEAVVQFGTGAFLRGFAEYFIDESNRRGEFNGSIVAVASTGSSRFAVLNGQDGLYTLAIRGVVNGSPQQRYRVIGALSRAVSASDQWDAVLAVAKTPALRLVISNTTEVGIAIDAEDTFDARPPKSFPAKLTRFLFERANAFEFRESAGVIVLPCELIERNGDALRDAVLELATRWGLHGRFSRWITSAVVFCNTLVDRIVPGAVPAQDAARIERVFGYRDGMITACEPYALWAIEGDANLRERLGFAGSDDRIVVAPDIAPYRERKVRLLNGAHTVMVPAALLAGLSTVRDACKDLRIGGLLRRALFGEVVPTLDVPGAAEFARDVLDRFANPFIDHQLIDITLHQTAKMRVRVVPSIVACGQRVGRTPVALAFGFAAYLAFMRGEVQTERRAAGLAVPVDVEGERVRLAWHDIDLACDEPVVALARSVCSDTSLWGVDLTSIDGFAETVGEHLVRIARHGVRAALEAYLNEPATLS